VDHSELLWALSSVTRGESQQAFREPYPAPQRSRHDDATAARAKGIMVPALTKVVMGIIEERQGGVNSWDTNAYPFPARAMSDAATTIAGLVEQLAS